MKKRTFGIALAVAGVLTVAVAQPALADGIANSIPQGAQTTYTTSSRLLVTIDLKGNTAGADSHLVQGVNMMSNFYENTPGKSTSTNLNAGIGIFTYQACLETGSGATIYDCGIVNTDSA